MTSAQKQQLAAVKGRVLSRLRAELAVGLANIVAGRTISDVEFAALTWSAVPVNPPLPTEPLVKTVQDYIESHWAFLSPHFRKAHNKLRQSRGLPAIPEPEIDHYVAPQGPRIRPVDYSDPELIAAAHAFIGGIERGDDDDFLLKLEIAKARAMTSKATDADLAPLRELLVELTGDPDIARFVQQPAPPKRGARRDYALNQPFETKRREVWLAIVLRIEVIVADETSQQRHIMPIVVAIAAEFLGCSKREIEELKKHPPRVQQAPSDETPAEFAARILNRTPELDAIRTYIERKTGKAPSDEQVVEHVVRVTGCEPGVIREIIKRAKAR
jgi:hypothetical protein